MSSIDFSDSPVAQRAVSPELQEAFAALSGDRNPMHMDPVAARRTQAGLPVVHGVHTLLWALESLAAAGRLDASLTRVKVRFLRWIYLGDEAVLTATDKSLQVEVEGLPVLSADLILGASVTENTTAETSPALPLTAALDLSFADLEGRTGQAYTAPDTTALFPYLTELFGATVAEIAACSYIIGMEAPGLHSMFSKLDLTLTPVPEGPHAALAYAVTYHDERFRKLRLAVTGRGITGTLDAFVRVPPVAQADASELAGMVTPGEFAGMRALIVGGSRGLGELTAKLIALGGGHPTITYALGKSDAEKVLAEIRAAGAQAEAIPYDIRQSPAAQLGSQAYTHLFYFATNTIFRPKAALVSAPVLADAVAFYLLGFHDLAVYLAARAPLVANYPSTVYVDERPAGLTEYAMMKAAGEQMCRDMNDHTPNLRVLISRLPRLPTDQTAGILPERDLTPADVLLPIVRQMSAFKPDDATA